MIELTCRFNQCRTRTRMQVVACGPNFVGKKEFYTVRFKHPPTGKTAEWSGDLTMPDSKVSVEKLRKAMTTELDRCGDKGNLFLYVYSWPHPSKSWECFEWSPASPEPVEPDTICDMFGK